MQTLVQRLRENADKYAKSVAIVDDEGSITYEQLWLRVCALASYLHREGIKKGDRVVLLLENSCMYAVAYYGVMSVGGIVVALNTAVKARDILNWTNHCDASWIIASSKHPEFLSMYNLLEKNVRILTVGADTRAGESKLENVVTDSVALTIEEEAIDPNKPAAIIYTSGTTGSPKGVTLSHRNLVANVRSILEYLKLSNNDSIVDVLPFYYSYGNSVLHTHLAAGARIVLENSLMYPHRVLERMASERATGFSGVPSTFSLLLSRAKLENYKLSHLRYVTQAGGPMPPAITKKLLEALPHVQLFVMYGQTEAAARLSYLPPRQIAEKLGSVGLAIPGVSIELRDKSGKICPPGVTGEICARGDNVMLGYWKDPESTARVIRDGWLYTGDLAHTDGEGYIYIDGRTSDMLKSGANRISPKEIEEVIAEMEGVEEVGVAGVADEILGQVVKAVIVVKPGFQISELSVRAHCRTNLAVYKIPKYIEFVEELPKTASGKLQRFRI